MLNMLLKMHIKLMMNLKHGPLMKILIYKNMLKIADLRINLQKIQYINIKYSLLMQIRVLQKLHIKLSLVLF